MSHRLVNTALSQHLARLGLMTQFENSPFVPVSGQTYIAELYLPARTISVGLEKSASDWFKGIYQVDVYAPRDTGKADGADVANRVAQHFARGTEIQGNNIKVLCAAVDQLQGMLMGDRFVTPVRVTFSSVIQPQ